MQENERENKVLKSGREIAYIAVFTAVVLVAQFCFSFIPSVEIVTLLFVGYAFTFGILRGMISATVFSLLRQLIFGFYPTVFIEYLLFYNALAACFGALGKRVKKPLKNIWWLTALACLFTVGFTMLDNIVTPLWYGLNQEAAKGYFIASLPVLLPQVLCTAITVGGLFYPLHKILTIIKKTTP